MDCIFCQIASQAVPTPLVYEDEQVVAFNDLNPQAPQHMLIIPRKHIATLNDMSAEDETLVGHLFSVAKQLATEQGFAEEGYRTALNCNPGGGQTVFHLHFHLLGGRPLQWPPG